MKKPQAKRSVSQTVHPPEQEDRRIVTAEWSGPLPPPSILQDFDSVVTDGAERIFAAWEKETNHRHQLERKDLWLTAFDAILGKIFAFLFVLLALGVCGFAIYMKAQFVAAILGGGMIASVVWAFVKVNRPKP